VVSNETYNDSTTDLIIAQITSNISGLPRQGDHHVADWKGAGLLAPSLVRAKLATVASARVFRTLGRLGNADMTAVEGRLRAVLRL
jgi:mRNA-degrading endonuclease toxin of MazEF toxin-antitoxin module